MWWTVGGATHLGTPVSWSAHACAPIIIAIFESVVIIIIESVVIIIFKSVVIIVCLHWQHCWGWGGGIVEVGVVASLG